MPFIKITAEMDKEAKRARWAPAFLDASIEAWKRRAHKGWVPVRSSWLKAVRYNKDRGTFDIRVKSGKEYTEYPDMTYEKFRKLLEVRSAGMWMWRHYPPKGKTLKKKS